MTEHNPDAEPAATGEPNPTDRGNDVTAGSVQQDMATGQLAVRNPYDTVVPETLRERIAYARAMAQAGILPRDYQAKPANVLVAGEMGRELGLSTVQAVLMLNVVEGRPQLGANGVRAVVLRAGHRMSAAAITYSKHGVPLEATVTGQRYRDGEPEGDPTTLVWNIARAHRAGLCTVRRDDDGEVTEVRARSQGGKVLPWEAYTEDMLDARATTKLGRTLFADVTMGLSYEADELAATPAPVATTAEQIAPPLSPRAQEVLDAIRPARRTSLTDDYDPAADVAEAGEQWWTHAGAQVSRRSKVQLAADRLARWVADNPDQDVVPLPELASDQEQAQVVEGAPVSDPDAEVVDAVVVEDVPEPEVPAPAEPDTMDPSDPGDPWAAPADEPTDAVPDERQGHDALPVETVPDDGPDLSPDTDLAAEPATAAEVLAMIDAAAERLGKSRAGLMVRWISTHRVNPEDATAEQLQAFYDQLVPTLEALDK